MAPNRKRLGIQAPEDVWKRLGELLDEWRRVQLGYRSRKKFAEARLPETPYGNPNVRLVTDIENNLRPNHWPAGTLRELAAAYGVTYGSVLAVLRREADKLSPAESSPPPAPTDPSRDSGRTPPAGGEDKIVMVIPLPASTAGPAQLPAPFTVKLGDGQVTLAGDTLMTSAQADVIIAALRKAFGEPPGQPA